MFKSQTDRWRQRFCVLIQTHMALFKDQAIAERPTDLIALQSIIKVTFSPRTKLLNVYTKEFTVTLELSSNNINVWEKFFALRGIAIIGEEDRDNIRIDISRERPKPIIKTVEVVKFEPSPAPPKAEKEIQC